MEERKRGNCAVPDFSLTKPPLPQVWRQQSCGGHTRGGVHKFPLFPSGGLDHAPLCFPRTCLGRHPHAPSWVPVGSPYAPRQGGTSRAAWSSWGRSSSMTPPRPQMRWSGGSWLRSPGCWTTKRTTHSGTTLPLLPAPWLPSHPGPSSFFPAPPGVFGRAAAGMAQRRTRPTPDSEQAIRDINDPGGRERPGANE